MFIIPELLSDSKRNNEMKKETIYDVIIIGGSYSGLAAAMSLGRAMMRVFVIDSGLPCNRQTPYSHNFLTQDGNKPDEITQSGKNQVRQYPTVEFKNDSAVKASKTTSGFMVETESGSVYIGKKLVFATGIKDLLPEIEGMDVCWGISVLHCPYCHGYEVRGAKTGILANGHAAFELSALISNWTTKLSLFTNGPSTLSHEQTDILHSKGILINEYPIKRLNNRDGYLQSIEFSNGLTENIESIYAKVPFEQHCKIPEQIGCEITEEGYLKTDNTFETTIKGLYACGDNAGKMRTVANAVATGTAAGMTISKKMILESFQPE